MEPVGRFSAFAVFVDDMLHVLQAIYCHFYVTEEPKQSQYASLLLTPTTRVGIYDHNTPGGMWLERLLEKAA